MEERQSTEDLKNEIPESEHTELDTPFDLTIVLKSGYEYHTVLSSIDLKSEEDLVNQLTLSASLDDKTLMYIQLKEIAMIFYTPHVEDDDDE